LLEGLALDYAANKKKNEAAEKRALAAQATTEEERQKLLKEARKADTTGKLASIGSSAATGAGIGATIGSVVPGVGNVIGGAVGGVIGGGIGVVKEYGDEIKKGLGDAFTSVSKKSSEVWSSVKTTGENVWGGITEKASGYWDTISGKATDSWNSVKAIGADTWNSITETANGAWEGIKGFGSGIWGSIKSEGESIWGGITSSADTAWEGIKGKGKEIWSSIKTKGKEIWGSIENIAKAPIDKIKSTFSNIFNLDSGIIGKTKDIFKNLLPDSVVSIMTSLGILEEEKKPTPPPKPQKVKDGSTVSNKGPFTISDKFGNIAITHPQDKLVVSPNISYVNDGISSPSRNQVFPVSEGFGKLDVKVSPKGVMVQKVKDGAIPSAPLSYQEVFGSTSATRVISSNVLRELGIPGVDDKNFKNQFSLIAQGNTNLIPSLSEMGKSKKLTLFTPSGTALAQDSFIVKYADGKTSQILDEGNIKFPQDSYRTQDLKEISASGNGLLALSRALNEVKPKEIEIGGGTTKTFYLPDRYNIGFKQERQSSAIKFDSGKINDLSEMSNSLNDALLYLAVNRQSIPLVEGIPTTMHNIKVGGERYEDQYNYAKNKYIPYTILGNTRNFIPKEMGYGNEALAASSLPPYDFSGVYEIVNKIENKVPQFKDIRTPEHGSIISLAQKAWKLIMDLFVPQYKDRALTFIEKYVSPSFYEKFKNNINPKIGSPILKFDGLFKDVKVLAGEGPPTANLQKTTSQYSEGLSERISDGVLLPKKKHIQQIQDGSSSKGPFTIADRFGNIAVTHPKDGIVVSPNISYVNDGVTDKKGPVFPISEKFGALDVKVSPKGVMVQKINDGISNKEIDKTKQEIWDKYKGENKRVIPGKPGIYAWDSINEKMFFINETVKSPSQITFANSETFHNYARVPERELIGVRSDMGFANPDKINLNTLKNLIYEAFGASEANPAGVGQKGNESTLDSILDPFQPDLIRQTIKGYSPLSPTKTTYFHTLPNKEGYRPPDLISISQSVSEGLSLEEATMPKLAEGGVVSKPTVALIGEAGPEAVVPLDQIAQESPQTSTTIVESDNSDLKKELQEMKQLMAGLISQIPSIANRPITVELNGNKVGQALGQNAYRM